MLHISGVPVRDGDARWLVEELEYVGGTAASSASVAIDVALTRKSQRLALSANERSAVLVALVDSPAGLDGLRLRLSGGVGV